VVASFLFGAGMKIGNKEIKKKYIVLLSLVALFIIGRATLPAYLHKKTNEYLSSFSPDYSLHIKDFDLSFVRMAYKLEGFTAKLKKDKDKKEFLNIREIDVSIAWRELFKGKISTDIIIKEPNVVVYKEVMDIKPPKKDDRSSFKDKIFPIKVEKVELRNANVTLDQYKDMDGKGKMKLSDINGKILNLTPKENKPLSRFDLTAKVFDTTKIKFDGDIRTLEKPLGWNADVEMKGANLTKFNPILKDKLPLTFTKGTMDLYAEAKSKKGIVKGYVKPFMNNLDIVKDEGENFKSVKHFGIEILTAIGNIILKDDTKKQSVATSVDFTYDGKLHVDAKEGVKKAIKNATADEDEPQDKIKRGVENRIGETGASEGEDSE
jgi:hypothetical protein